MRQHIQSFETGEHYNMHVLPSHLVTLLPQAQAGEWTSPVYAAEPFNQVIASWNALTPGASWIEVQLRLRLGDWTTWYSLGQWGSGIPSHSIDGQTDVRVAVEVDTLLCRQRQADAWQTRVTLHADPQTGDAPTLMDILVWAGQRGSRQSLSMTPHVAWGRILDAPTRSQAVEPAELRWHICSPTSLGMVLAYHGVALTTTQMYAGVFDHSARIWGNWPFNAAYVLPASQGRLIGHVERWDSFQPLEDEIAAGRPVVLSHRWQEGDLAGATAPRSNGHLIVVVGFDVHGDVVVNDPAANPTMTQSVRRTYRRQDIYRTWLERGAGVVYTVKPR